MNLATWGIALNLVCVYWVASFDPDENENKRFMLGAGLISLVPYFFVFLTILALPDIVRYYQNKWKRKSNDQS